MPNAIAAGVAPLAEALVRGTYSERWRASGGFFAK
jgi:hypothetical protein